MPRFANAELPDRSAIAESMRSPPGGGWCVSAVMTIRGNVRAPVSDEP
jgi:hypothetical protein